MLLDLLGLSNLFGRNCMNSTWWYMSAAIMFIALTPLIDASSQRFGSIMTMTVIFALPRTFGYRFSGTYFFEFLPIFCIGLIFAKAKFFENWDSFWKRIGFGAEAIRFAFGFLLILGAYKLFLALPTDRYWDIKWDLLPIPVIVFLHDFVFVIPIVRQILLFIGRHATNIFLIHTFIRYYYFEEFIYTRGHFLVIILVLLGISIVLSYFAEALKKLLKYDVFIKRIIASCTK